MKMYALSCFLSLQRLIRFLDMKNALSLTCFSLASENREVLQEEDSD